MAAVAFVDVNVWEDSSTTTVARRDAMRASHQRLGSGMGHYGRRQYRSISNGRKICGPQCWREDLRMNKIAPATARVHLSCIRAGLRER
jgi:hypothetical protein